MPYITCKDLVLGYEGKALLEPLNFRIHKGDYFCIVGENGSGKSTLMKTLLHLTQPISGEIIYDEGLHANEIGYLPQQTIAQRDFPASVREIVLSGCQASKKFHPFYTREEKQRAADAMKKMEISELENRCYRELSGGQQQRVLLARALCATEKVLLLDEPVSGLDPKVTMEMYQLISSLNKEGITIIMISHDVQAAITYASRILHIGEQVFLGTTEEYLESESGKLFAEMGQKLKFKEAQEGEE